MCACLFKGVVATVIRRKMNLLFLDGSVENDVPVDDPEVQLISGGVRAPPRISSR